MKHLIKITFLPLLVLTLLLLIFLNNNRLLAENETTNKSVADKYWTMAMREVYSSPEELLAQHERVLKKGLLCRKLIKGNPKIKSVALTFDDGPHVYYTQKILEILKQYNVKATFFVVGKMAEKNPALLRAEVKGGHLIGNHTFHHVNLTRLSEDEVKVEWQACNDVVKAITGVDMSFCRPPGGQYNTEVLNAAMDVGLTTVLWSDNPGDYKKPSDDVLIKKVMDKINPGGIIVLHDGVQQTIDVLPAIIEALKKQGYKFQTVKEMLLNLNNK